MIVAIAVHANRPGQTVYQIGSSNRNPVKYSYMPRWGYTYFSKNPSTDYSNGKTVIVKKVKILETMERFHSYMYYHYILPLKVY